MILDKEIGDGRRDDRRHQVPHRKRRRGRPVELKMLEPIPETAENIARTLFNTPPNKEDEWDYLKQAKAAAWSLSYIIPLSLSS